MNHIKTAHLLWKDHILSIAKKQNTLPLCFVDATCGNGHDSLFLSQFSNRSLHCIDIQEISIRNTKTLLPDENAIHFHNRSHEDLSQISSQIDLIIYNLGYLPGSDKKIITKSESTIKSLQAAVKKLSPNGLISITIYTGHDGGKTEEEAILDFTSELSSKYKIMKVSFLNKKSHPYLLFIKST